MGDTRLVVGNYNYSSWSLRAWLALRKAGAGFTVVRLPLDTAQFRERIGELSPTGRVPVLHHGERVVWDSLAIAEYASETFADGRLWPADAGARATGRSASAEMHSGFPILRARMPMNVRAHGRRVGLDAALNEEIARIAGLWTDCLERYGGPWLLGGFSIADAMFAPVASRFHTYGVELPEPAAAFRDHVLADPDMAEWIAEARAEPETIAREERGQSGSEP